MVKKNWLNCLEKRDVLNQSPISVESLKQWGEQYEEEGLDHDAFDFYQKAAATEALRRLLKRAEESGDYFLFCRICRVINHEPSEEEWVALARQAESLGKNAYAKEAYRRAGKEIPDDNQATMGRGESGSEDPLQTHEA